MASGIVNRAFWLMMVSIWTDWGIIIFFRSLRGAVLRCLRDLSARWFGNIKILYSRRFSYIACSLLGLLAKPLLCLPCYTVAENFLTIKACLVTILRSCKFCLVTILMSCISRLWYCLFCAVTLQYKCTNLLITSFWGRVHGTRYFVTMQFIVHWTWHLLLISAAVFVARTFTYWFLNFNGWAISRTASPCMTL